LTIVLVSNRGWT